MAASTPSATTGLRRRNCRFGGQQATGGGGTDTLVSIEGAVGSKFNDTLTGDRRRKHVGRLSRDDLLNGGGGSTTRRLISSRSGRDGISLAGTQNTEAPASYAGFDENLSVRRSSTRSPATTCQHPHRRRGNDVLNGGAARTPRLCRRRRRGERQLVAGTATGGDGNDTLAAIENVVGGIFNDTIVASNGDNVINGGSGTDPSATPTRRLG